MFTIISLQLLLKIIDDYEYELAIEAITEEEVSFQDYLEDMIAHPIEFI